MERTPEVISRLLLERAPWDAIDDAYASKIPFDCPHESADLLRRMVSDHTSTAHRFVLDGRRAGLLITRVEAGTAGKELVCQAMFAETADGLPITELIGDACEGLARAEGCNCLRFHTCRPQMARFAADRFGYRLSELVMRKTLLPA
jgi:hypothetical protein